MLRCCQRLVRGRGDVTSPFSFTPSISFTTSLNPDLHAKMMANIRASIPHENTTISFINYSRSLWRHISKYIKYFTQRTSTGAHCIMPNLESLVLTRCKPEITKQRALVVARSRWHASPSGEDHRYPGSLRNIYVTPVQRHGTASGMPSWRTPLLGTIDAF